MKYTQPEKMEIIRMVEESSLSVKKSCREIAWLMFTFFSVTMG